MLIGGDCGIPNTSNSGPLNSTRSAMPVFRRLFAGADVGSNGEDADTCCTRTRTRASAGRRRFVGAAGRWWPLIPPQPEVPIGSNHQGRFGCRTPPILPSPRRTPLFSVPSVWRWVPSDAVTLARVVGNNCLGGCRCRRLFI